MVHYKTLQDIWGPYGTIFHSSRCSKEADLWSSSIFFAWDRIPSVSTSRDGILKKVLKPKKNLKYQKYPNGFERFETNKPIIHIMPANIYTDSVGSQPFPICWWFEIASGKITMYVQNHHWITLKSPLNHNSSPEISINIHWKSTKIHEISTTIPWTSTKIYENPIENPLKFMKYHQKTSCKSPKCSSSLIRTSHSRVLKGVQAALQTPGGSINGVPWCTPIAGWLISWKIHL